VDLSCSTWSRRASNSFLFPTSTSGESTPNKLLGAYDVGADRLWGHLEKRPVTAAVVLEFLRDIRRRYPADTTLYIVMDNLSAHWTAEIRRWALSNNVGLLPGFRSLW
jgi:DDE superfamily endonuclease